MVQKDRAIKSFLFENMYRHPSVTKETGAAREVVRELFEGFMEAPGRMPEQWRRLTDGAGTPGTARVVADYIAGMTDRYAERAHRQLQAGKAPAE
jgi:dGTPase